MSGNYYNSNDYGNHGAQGHYDRPPGSQDPYNPNNNQQPPQNNPQPPYTNNPQWSDPASTPNSAYSIHYTPQTQPWSQQPQQPYYPSQPIHTTTHSRSPSENPHTLHSRTPSENPHARSPSEHPHEVERTSTTTGVTANSHSCKNNSSKSSNNKNGWKRWTVKSRKRRPRLT
ncbi:hypothetical protein BC829DRAFT_375823 [Chytridium lagenaria]|nr:hypothetical protein BC829DRAFT_375823 [Chytridium lagenaria]